MTNMVNKLIGTLPTMHKIVKSGVLSNTRESSKIPNAIPTIKTIIEMQPLNPARAANPRLMK